MSNLIVSNAWVRRWIAKEQEQEIEAGSASGLFPKDGPVIESEQPKIGGQQAELVPLHHAFGVFVRQLRLRDGKTVQELADEARIDENELRTIEHDASHIPKPRTVHQLSEHFGLPESKLQKLAGVVSARDTDFIDEAMKFAAKSDDLSRLTEEEHQALNEFVRYLTQMNEGEK